MGKRLQLGSTGLRVSLKSLVLPRSGRVRPNSPVLYGSGPRAGPGVGYILHRRGCSLPRPDPALLQLEDDASGAEDVSSGKGNISRLLGAGCRGGKALGAQRSPGNAQRGNLRLNRWQPLPRDGRETKDIPRQPFGFVMDSGEQEGESCLWKGSEVSLSQELKQGSPAERQKACRIAKSCCLAQASGWEAQRRHRRRPGSR